MSVQHPTLVTTLVLVMAAAIIAQTAMLVLAIFHLRRALQQLNQAIDLLSEKSSITLNYIVRVVTALEESTGRLPEVQQPLQALLERFMEAIRKTNEALAQRVELLRTHLEDMGSGMEAAVGKFSQQTFRVHRAVQDPSMRLSAIIRSALVTLKQVLSREDGSPASHSPDQELFI